MRQPNLFRSISSTGFFGAALSLAACAAPPTEAVGESEAALGIQTLTLGATIGAETTTAVPITGQDRASVPSGYGWTCGTPTTAYEGSMNVAWVEIKNPTAHTVEAYAALEGLTDTYPVLLAYPTTTAAAAPAIDCVAVSRSRAFGEGNGLVIAPNASLFVRVAVSNATGIYTLRVKTSAVAAPSTLTLAPTVGAETTTAVPVTGQLRASLPSQWGWSCGTPTTAYARSNVAWATLTNPTSKVVSVSLKLDGLEDTYPSLYAYASDVISTGCLTSSASRVLTAERSVVLEPNGTVYILVAVPSATGIYTLTAKPDVIVD